MADPAFFPFAASLEFGEVASVSGAPLPEGVDAARRIEGAAALEMAGPTDLAYMDNPKYVEALITTRPGSASSRRVSPTGCRPAPSR